MRRVVQAVIGGALVWALVAGGRASAQSLGFMALPSTVPQYLGYGYGAGHHVPIVRTPQQRPDRMDRRTVAPPCCGPLCPQPYMPVGCYGPGCNGPECGGPACAGPQLGAPCEVVPQPQAQPQAPVAIAPPQIAPPTQFVPQPQFAPQRRMPIVMAPRPRFAPRPQFMPQPQFAPHPQLTGQHAPVPNAAFAPPPMPVAAQPTRPAFR